MRGLAPPRLRTAQAGISLVETMVALVLGLAMVSVAFNLYVSNRAVFRQIEGMVRLQESASIATALLETDIRHAAGTLCRNNPPTTSLLAETNAFWETSPDNDYILLGLRGYESTQTDEVVGTLRLAGDSISLMSDNMGAVARVTGRATHTSAPGSGGLIGSYTFPIDNGSNFPVGTVAMACDYTRAVLFQVTEPPTSSSITLQAGGGGGPSPGNCAVTMRREATKTDGVQNEPVAPMNGVYRCYAGQGDYPKLGYIYPFGPGSMVAEHTFHHWYIGKKTSTDACCSLRRVRATYSSTGVGSTDEEILENATDMQITYLPGSFEGYPGKSFYIPSTEGVAFDGATAVRIVLTLTSPDKVGLAANNAASAATYTIPINVAIRARMPGVVRR